MKLEQVKREEELIKQQLFEEHREAQNRRYQAVEDNAPDDQNVDVRALKRVFDTTDSVETLIRIGAYIWHMRYGEAVSKAGRGYKLSADWIAEDAIRILAEHPQKKAHWLKAHRTRIRNILDGSVEDKQASTQRWKNMYAKNYNSIKFFSKWLLDNYMEDLEDENKYKSFQSSPTVPNIDINEEDIPF